MLSRGGAAKFVRTQQQDVATLAELAVQQPTEFEMFVNSKAAKALGIKIPDSILLGVDQAIV